MSNKLPWFKHHPKDWQTDEGLNACSLAARGLWLECLNDIHIAGDRGRLTINGKPPTLQQLARKVRADVQEVEALLAELHGAGVFDYADDGAIFSRRMARDMEDHERRVVNGRMGGRPKRPPDEPPQEPPTKPEPKPPTKPPSKPQPKPEQNQKGGRIQSSELRGKEEQRTGSGKGTGEGRTWKSGRGVGGFMPGHLQALDRGDPAPLLAQVKTATGEGTPGFRPGYDCEAAVLAHGFDALAAAGPGKSSIGLFVHRLQKLGTRDAIAPSDEAQARAKATLRAMTSGGLASFAHAAGFGSMGSQADVDAALRIYGNGGAE